MSVAAGSVLVSQGSQFLNNGASRGGALYGGGASITLVDTLLSGNSASTTGGAVFTELGGSLTVQTSNFTNNQAGEAHKLGVHLLRMQMDGTNETFRLRSCI